MNLFASTALVIALSGSPLVATQDKTDAKAAEKAAAAAKLQAEREDAFATRFSGSTLSGQFTIDGRDGLPGKELYEIESVRKLRGDIWVFTARIKYGKHDIKVPMQLRVLWSGDTPVINMDDFTIPLMGTFDFRVMFHGDRYVGSWQHGNVGGHMFGRIEKTKADKEKDKADDENQSPAK
jgi:hypothetical protein